MSILEKTPDGFVLHVTRAEKSLCAAQRSQEPDVHALRRGSRIAVSALDRATLIRALLSVWSKGAVPILVSDARSLEGLETSAPALLFGDTAFTPQDIALAFRAEEPLCELYTSGSSGTPRIFPKCARQLFGEAFALKEMLALAPADVVLSTTASHHLYGLLFGVLAPWAGGASIVAGPQNEPSRFHPESVAALTKEAGATHLVSVPAHLRALLQASVELPSVHTIVSSAAPLTSEDARRLEEKFGARVLDVLGSTETGGLATRRAAAPAIWTPLPGVRVRLDNQERLLLSSPFLSDPFTEERSEERARVHSDGTFEYLGRADKVVKVGGKRIDLREIELLVETLAGVTDCACLSQSVTSLRGEEILLAVATTTWSKEALRTALREKCDPTFLPRKIRIVESLPRDERGKLKREALLGLFLELSMAPKRVEKPVKVPVDWHRFSGHFENDPLLPALSQLSDIILPAMRQAFGGGALASLRRVKWTRRIRPGAELSLHLEKKNKSIGFQLWEGENLACSGTATLHAEGP